VGRRQVLGCWVARTDSRHASIDHVKTAVRDYSIVGPEAQHAVTRGLVDAHWYTTPIEREQLRILMQRRDGPAIRDTLLWFALLGGSGFLAHRSWGTWWMVPAFFVYGTFYGSVSDSRWHECGHRTAFRTTWMNDALYFLSSFMVWREAVSWRWSHIRHHSDTIVVGRDPEIAFQRPMRARKPLMEFFGLASNPGETRKILLNVVGRFTVDELDYLPPDERPKAVRTARIYVTVWFAVLAACVVLRTVEPLMFVVLPSFYGKWLLVAYGITQHAGLAEDTLDHRLNSRSVRMNRVHRYLYWNMNFHTEHHMFPNVPFHALPALSEATKADFPPQYSGIFAAYREILSAYRQQKRDPGYFIDRTALIPNRSRANHDAEVPEQQPSLGTAPSNPSVVTTAGWITVADSSALTTNDVMRFDHGDATFAVFRLGNGQVRATDGLCTHAQVHLCGGLVRDGQIECPKHNGRFDIETGTALSRPVTVALHVHDAREFDGSIQIRPRDRPE
jgi:Na+-transporting NADH:ubiquinone oxidoreductase subunit F